MPTDHQASRRFLEQATRDPASRTEAHYLLWEICQVCGDPEAARRHLDAAIRLDPVHTRPGRDAIRSVLAIATQGDFQANLPLAMLFDDSTALHTLWLTPGAPPPTRLPQADCVIIAIAEAAAHRAALAAADQLAASLGLPVINHGGTIASLSRAGTARLLSDVPGAVVPEHTVRSRAWLPLAPVPFIVRPCGSHAGRDLALIRDRAELDRYLDRPHLPEAFVTAPFVDYRSPDRLYRKCRIAFVGGRPLSGPSRRPRRLGRLVLQRRHGPQRLEAGRGSVVHGRPPRLGRPRRHSRAARHRRTRRVSIISASTARSCPTANCSSSKSKPACSSVTAGSGRPSRLLSRKGRGAAPNPAKGSPLETDTRAKRGSSARRSLLRPRALRLADPLPRLAATAAHSTG